MPAHGLDSRHFTSIVVKPEFSQDLDDPVTMLDWDANVNPEFVKSNKIKPRPVKALEEMKSEESC